VGDNVGDIAGMGADLFGSFAESTVAALVVAAASSLGTEHNWTAMSFPLLITAFSILVCAATTLLATDFRPATTIPEIEPALKMQLIVSTVLMTPVAAGIAMVALPNEFTLVFPSSVAGELFSVKARPAAAATGGRRTLSPRAHACMRARAGRPPAAAARARSLPQARAHTAPPARSKPAPPPPPPPTTTSPAARWSRTSTSSCAC